MIAYIGDISIADAELLEVHARMWDKILEFGCGASTQVIAKYKRPGVKFTTIDTSVEWMDKTLRNLELLGIDPVNSIDMFDYSVFMKRILQTPDTYNLIFNDGVDSLRRQFAIDIWPFLSPGGVMLFHDTRRAPDFRNVLEILAQFHTEIGLVQFNASNSNITVVQKVTPKPYDNWQITEKKEPWMLGYGEIPEHYKEVMRNSE